jgi:hypothetical protein
VKLDVGVDECEHALRVTLLDSAEDLQHEFDILSRMLMMGSVAGDRALQLAPLLEVRGRGDDSTAVVIRRQR